MIRRLLVIYGASGAGKSTLARNLLGEFTEEITEEGTLSCSKDKSVVALGKYSVKCGGTDTIKETKHLNGIWKMLKRAYNNKPECRLFIIEGMMLSALWGAPIKNLLDLKYNQGFDIEMVHLSNSVETCYRRVFGRNERLMDIEQLISKVNAVSRVFKKMGNLGEFHCFSIKCDNLDSNQVFETYKQNSKFFRG
jgi:hypothetical protein